MEASLDDRQLVELHAFCLSGEGCTLKVSSSTLGREVLQMVSRHLPKRGAKPTLQHLASPLILDQTLREQSITGETATLSCTYVPTDLVAAWKLVVEFSENRPYLFRAFPPEFHSPLVCEEGENLMQGVTRIVGRVGTASVGTGINAPFRVPGTLPSTILEPLQRAVLRAAEERHGRGGGRGCSRGRYVVAMDWWTT
eukprot:Skav234030  [mRNA]  locus=scaffold1723:108684:111476:+ [translate_table: standard]